MKKKTVIWFVVCIAGLSAPGLSVQPPPENFYGYTIPKDSAEIFAPGVISTGYNEFTPTVSPDGDELLFSRRIEIFSIYVLRYESMQSTSPKVVSFSGRHDDVDCVFSPDGNKLFFASKRPVNNESLKSDYDFWAAEKINGQWMQPKHEGDRVNSAYDDLFSSVSGNGTKYFDFNGDIFKSVVKNGEYGEKENLGAGINTEHLEKEPFIAPDESYLIFVSNRPEENLGDVDLYISFRNQDSTWGPPINMGKEVNSVSTDQAPVVTLDGRLLFFSSRREIESNTNENIYGNGSSDIYWIEADIIDRLKTQNSEFIQTIR